MPVVTIVIKDANTGEVIDPSTIVEPADPANIQSSEWSRANLFVSGPRSHTVPVLTTASEEASPALFYVLLMRLQIAGRESQGEMEELPAKKP